MLDEAINAMRGNDDNTDYYNKLLKILKQVVWNEVSYSDMIDFVRVNFNGFNSYRFIINITEYIIKVMQINGIKISEYETSTDSEDNIYYQIASMYTQMIKLFIDTGIDYSKVCSNLNDYEEELYFQKLLNKEIKDFIKFRDLFIGDLPMGDKYKTGRWRVKEDELNILIDELNYLANDMSSTFKTSQYDVNKTYYVYNLYNNELSVCKSYSLFSIAFVNQFKAVNTEHGTLKIAPCVAKIDMGNTDVIEYGVLILSEGSIIPIFRDTSTSALIYRYFKLSDNLEDLGFKPISSNYILDATKLDKSNSASISNEALSTFDRVREVEYPKFDNVKDITFVCNTFDNKYIEINNVTRDGYAIPFFTKYLKFYGYIPNSTDTSLIV